MEYAITMRGKEVADNWIAYSIGCETEAIIPSNCMKSSEIGLEFMIRLGWTYLPEVEYIYMLATAL